MSNAFLDDAELVALTGRKMKSRQIIELRRMGLPFFVNATGHAVVARSVIDGKADIQPKKPWVPKVLRTA